MSVNIRNPITGDLTNASGGVINPKSINEMIAPIEDGTASKAYAVGEQFIMNELLCEATQAIAQGDTMVIGTNCEESEQLSKQVREINDSLTANGNRFEAGYSSENDEYGFNIGSTFYPIGASSGGGVMVDTALDSTSENPVQNKVITGEINDIKSALSDYVIVRANNKTGVSVGADANVEINGYIDEVSGYKPLLVIYKNNNGSNAIFASDAVSDVISDGVGLKYTLRITNPTNNNFNDFTVRMRVIYIRDI